MAGAEQNLVFDLAPAAVDPVHEMVAVAPERRSLAVRPLTVLVAGFLCLLGYQLVLFAVFTKIFAIREGFHPPHPMLLRLFDYVTLEVGLGVGALMALAGAIGMIAAVISWQAVGFGNLDPSLTMREVIPAVVLMALGTQTVFASFFISILSIER